MKMKKVITILFLLLWSGISFSQTSQIGYVRTIQKRGKPVKYLSDASIKTLGNPNESVSQEGGYYEIPLMITNGRKGYTITSVSLDGYVVDEAVLNRYRDYSLSPFDIVMDSKENVEKQKNILLDKQSAQLKSYYEKKLSTLRGNYDEIQRLNKEYEAQLNDLPTLINRLIWLDYRNITDTLDVQIANAYENGDYSLAIELIDKVHPSISSLIDSINMMEKSGQLLVEAGQMQLNKSEEMKAQALLCCEAKISFFSSTFNNDSVLYYLEQTVRIDPTNSDYVGRLGKFLYQFYNDYEGALKCYSTALELANKKGNNVNDILVLNNCIGVLLMEKGEFDEAFRSIDKAINQGVDLIGEENKCISSLYNTMGELNRRKGDFEQAKVYYEKALEINRSLFGEESVNNGVLYNSLGELCRLKGEYNKALKYFESSYNQSQDPLLQAQVLNNIGVTCYNLGELDKAIVFYEKALDIRIPLLGENNLRAADSYSNMGVAYWKNGDYDKAMELFSKTIGVYTSVLGEKNYRNANVYNSIGAVYYDKGDVKKAMEYFNKALDIYIPKMGENDLDIANVYGNIGEAYKMEKQFEKALEYENKALQIHHTILGEEHPDVASDYVNIGFSYSYQGKHDIAVTYLEKALKIRLNCFGGNSNEVGDIYVFLGQVYYSAGDARKSLECFERALPIRRLNMGENAFSVFELYVECGSVSVSLGAYDKAMSYFDKAERIENVDAENAALLYNNIGWLKEMQKEHTLALLYFNKALRTLQDSAAEKSDNTLQIRYMIYSNMGFAYYSEKKYEEALESFNSAKIIGESLHAPNLSIVEKYIEICQQAIDN